MKKLLLGLVLSFALILGACSNDNAEKKEDSKKSESVEKKKDTAKKSEPKKDTAKKDNESTEQTEQASTEEPNTQEQQSQEVAQQEPTDQEKAEANAEVAKQHGDVPVGQIELPPDELAKEEAKPEYQDVVEPEEPSEWVKGQDEWNNASESERVEMQKESARENGVEYDPKDFEVE